MKLKELLSNIDTQKIPQREVEDLICHILNLSWGEMQVQKENIQLNDQQSSRFSEMFVELQQGKPLAYLLGSRAFYKFEFFVNPSVLIPRPETEILVEKALGLLPQSQSLVLDLGAGSGCIGLSIAKERVNSEALLIEASPEAMKVAKANASKLSVENVQFYNVRLGEEAFELPEHKAKVDLIVSNPPYIAEGDQRVLNRVSQYEPHMALYAPENGLFWIHKWLIWGYDYLKAGGFFIFEFGQNQEDEIQKLIDQTSYEVVELIRDYSGTPRFFKLRK